LISQEVSMANVYEGELEAELEHELHEMHETHEMHEGEGEMEGGFLGNILGGLLGEGEMEGEGETHEFELELEGEGEFEAGEQFFGKIFKGIGNLVRKAAPILKTVAKVAAPMVGTAIGGPFGAVLGNLASSALGEGELEGEFELEMELEGEGEGEGELEFETEMESESEIAHEIVSHEHSEHEALAEMMAEAASHEQHEGEAEAMAGAAAVSVISPADRRALRRILPHMMRGVAILTRILRRRRITRPAVRAIPTIVRRTVAQVKKQAAAGRPITRKTVGRIAAGQVKKVLGSPRICTAAIARNLKASRAVRGRRVRSVRG
jgi:hypothetical protein